MKKLLYGSFLVASTLYATNGDNLIGLGTESRAMGGTGVALGMDADSVFKNPAWIADVEGLNAIFAATIFMPTVKAKNASASGQEATSGADMSLIPEISVASNINENLSYGVGMFGTSGMGVDYRGESAQKGLMEMRTNFQYLRAVPSVSYKADKLRLGAGITVAYGSLNIGAVLPSDMTDMSTMAQRGGGVSEDFGLGFQLGAGYYLTDDVTLGAYYQSQVNTTYENVFDFNLDGAYDELKLCQPAEYGLGVAYNNKQIAVTADYRKILWSSADGYDGFEWQDQDVFALGASYTMDRLKLMLGYNHAKSTLDEKSVANPQLAMFNLLGFPALSEAHYTTGLSYKLTQNIGVDLAYVYAPKSSESSYGFEASNKQSSVTIALNYSY